MLKTGVEPCVTCYRQFGRRGGGGLRRGRARKDRTRKRSFAKLLEGRVAGEAQQCIPLSIARSSQIVDRTAIVYRVGNTLWGEPAARRAEWLDDDDILVTKTIGSQLCSTTRCSWSIARHFYRGLVRSKFVPYRR